MKQQINYRTRERIIFSEEDIIVGSGLEFFCCGVVYLMNNVARLRDDVTLNCS